MTEFRNDEITVPVHLEVIASVATDVDLTSNAYPGPSDHRRFCRVLTILTPGTLVIVNPDESEETIPAGPAGMVIVGQFRGLIATGTTATNILAQW